MARLRIRIDGDGAAAAADELARLIEGEFGVAPQREDTAHAKPAGTRSWNDAATIAALIMALPQALDAAANLAERARLKERLGRLIGWARAARGDGREVWVQLPDGGWRRLDRTEAAEILDQLDRDPG